MTTLNIENAELGKLLGLGPSVWWLWKADWDSLEIMNIKDNTDWINDYTVMEVRLRQRGMQVELDGVKEDIKVFALVSN